MAIRLKYRAPTGETRPWTLREILEGKPIDRPTHPMLVHFPIAFYIGALGLGRGSGGSRRLRSPQRG
jgi:hypothetical protein